MPVEKGQRLKLLKIWEILRQETDIDHTLTTVDLLERLEDIGIKCDRRTLYADIKALNDNGYKVNCVRRIANEYYVEKREFSMAEIHILMDAVQAASFITEKKTAQLVDKIAELAGSRRAEAMKQNVVAFNTVKSPNEDIFVTVATISAAIDKYRKIEFMYFDYDLNRNRIYRKDNKVYKVNPVATIFSNDKYYLLCYDDKHGNLVHYRIDRMDRVKQSSEDISPSDIAEITNIQKHKKQLFGMYHGEECEVTFEADKSLTDAVFDRFGFGVRLYNVPDKKFRFKASVQLSPVFLGWCCSFGSQLKVVSPDALVKQLQSYINELKSVYEVKK